MSHPIPGHVYGENEKEGGEDTLEGASEFRQFAQRQEDDPYHDIVVQPFEQSQEIERRDDYERYGD